MARTVARVRRDVSYGASTRALPSNPGTWQPRARSAQLATQESNSSFVIANDTSARASRTAINTGNLIAASAVGSGRSRTNRTAPVCALRTRSPGPTRSYPEASARTHAGLAPPGPIDSADEAPTNDLVDVFVYLVVLGVFSELFRGSSAGTPCLRCSPRSC